jgi:hypothetical protein
MNLTPYIKLKLLRHSLACFALATCSATLASAAVTWHDVQFGGFASQGYIANTGNNDYLGDTSGGGTFDFREYAANASYARDEWRIGAQIFGQKLGDYGNDRIALDWASIDYQPAQWFGVRAGRVKTPRGLYNEALDLDSVRPFVLLPQSVYDARLRNFNAAFNGAMFFGNVGLKKVGSLDYRVYYGDIPLSTSSGASDYFNNDAPIANGKIAMDATYGGSLFWNTPLQGLKLGYSYTEFKNFFADRILDGGSGVAHRATPHYVRQLVSAELSRGDWVFALEFGEDTALYYIALPPGAGTPPPGAPPGGPGGAGVTVTLRNNASQDFQARYGYISVARRITQRFELGAYMSYSRDVLLGVGPYRLSQMDYAISGHYDINDHLLVKVEVHQMNGSGKLFDTASHSQPIAGRDSSWTLFAVKTTLSF